MPDFFKSVKLTQPTPGGPLVEQVVGAVQTSTGTAADAGKLVVLNATGQIDSSMISGGSSSVSVNGTAVSSPNFNDTTPAAPGGHSNVQWQFDLSGNVSAYYITSGTTVPFTAITTGTNTTAVMTVGTGGTLTFSGTGVVNANQLEGISVTNTPTHEGQLLIVQPGLTTLAYADPQVQGLYDAGSTISPAPAFVAPTNIQPVLIGGSDGTVLRNILTDSSGHLVVNVNGTVPISGTVAVTQSTSPWVVSGTVTANQGTSPWVVSLTSTTITGTVAVTQSTSPWVTSGNLTHNNAAPTTNNVGVLPAVASSANPTYNAGDQVLLSTDLSGALRVASSGTFTPALTSDRTSTGTITTTQSVTVSTSGGGAVVFNITGTWTGTIVFEYSVDGTNFVSADANPYQGSSTPATSTTGNGQWTLNCAGLNSFRVRGNSVATGTATAWLEVGAGTSNAIMVMGTNASNVPKVLNLDGAGNLNVNTQASVFATANGTAIPASTAWIGASDGTNLQGLRVSTSTDKELRVAVYQGGNIANVTSNRLLVDPSGVTSPVSIAGTVLVSNTTQNYTQTSTTSGQIGPLVQGAVTTNDPTYTTAQTSPLSLTTAGHLRSQDFATSSTGIAVPTKAMFVGGIGADGFLHGLSTDNSGILNVNASFSGTVTPGFVTDRVQSGSITNTQNVAISTYGAASVIFNITGSWTGTIQFQSQLADNSWVTATAYPVFTGGASVTQTSANGEWQIPVGGMQAFRVLGNTVTSGTATANLEAGAGAYSLFVQQLSASDLNATVVQGTAGTQAQSWFVKVSDGTNPLGTSANPFIIAGSKTNNNAAPGANNVGVLPALANSSAPSYTDGDQVLLSVDTTGALRVSSSGTFTPALTADITSTGTITNTQSITLSTQGTGTTLFNITGSWTGTIVFEASVDGTNFLAAKAVAKYPLTVPGVSQTTANGQWAISTGGLNKFRLRGNTVTSGTATVWIEGGAGAQDVAVFSIITDPVSSNTPAVKGSTTVPVAADNALVVSLSPNSAQFATSTTANALPGTNPVTVGTSSTAVVNSNASRKEVTVVNTGTTVIFLGLGQTPTNTAYHIALAKCTAANDGTGGTWTSDMFKGTVNAIGSGAGGTVVWTELT